MARSGHAVHTCNRMLITPVTCPWQSEITLYLQGATPRKDASHTFVLWRKSLD